MYYEPLKRFQNCAGLAILHIAFERFSFHLAVDQERLFQNQFQVIQDQEPTRPLILIHLVQFTGQNVKLIRQWARIAQKNTKSLSKQLCKGDSDLFQEFSHARTLLLSFSISQDSSTTGRNEDKDANKLLYNFLFPYYAYEKITKYTSCKHFQIWALLVLLISLLDFVVLSKSLIAVTSGNPTCYFSRSLCWLLQDKISLKADVNFISIA